ncbi:hypothetical protein EI067_18955 [Mycobacterium paragordonae]|nr:hypothetical protein EI067_18955 [Mycobacterium paragordonae]
MRGRRSTGKLTPLPRSRIARLAWSWVRHPVRSREYPADRERLITAQEFPALTSNECFVRSVCAGGDTKT